MKTYKPYPTQRKTKPLETSSPQAWSSDFLNHPSQRATPPPASQHRQASAARSALFTALERVHQEPLNPTAGMEPTKGTVRDFGSIAQAYFATPDQNFGDAVIQCKKDIDMRSVRTPTLPRYSDTYKQGFYSTDINWVDKAKETYDLIEEARTSAAGDTGAIAFLDNFEREFDECVEKGNALIKTFDEVLARPSGTTRKSAKRALELPSGSVNPALRTTKEALAPDLNRVVTQVITKFNKLKAEYKSDSGSFSAKGRALNIDTQINTTATGADDRYIAGTLKNNTSLSGGKHIHKPPTAPKNDKAAPRANGSDVPKADLHDPTVKATKLSTFQSTITQNPVGRRKTYKGKIAARDRGAGQNPVMNNTSARGYAWMTDTKGWDTRNWQWLHIQAASLSGETAPTNLVLGTEDANTHMMPFESNIKMLSKLANDHPQYKELEVTFGIANKQTHSHRYQDITLNWTLKKSDDAPATVQDHTGNITFKPLENGAPIAKEEVDFIQSALKNDRPEIPEASSMDLDADK